MKTQMMASSPLVGPLTNCRSGHPQMSGATSLSSPAEAFTNSQTPRYGSFANVSYSATRTSSAIITSEPEVKLQNVPYQRHGLVMYCKMLYTDHLDHFSGKGHNHGAAAGGNLLFAFAHTTQAVFLCSLGISLPRETLVREPLGQWWWR